MVEKARRLSITETRQGQELHVLRSLSFAKGIDEGSLQCIILPSAGGDKMVASTSPAVMLSRAATT